MDACVELEISLDRDDPEQEGAYRVGYALTQPGEAAELHKLVWETLRNPLDGTPLYTNENLLFSRYLTTQDRRALRLPPREELRAVLAAASPQDLDRLDLSTVDVAGELRRAAKGLAGEEQPAGGRPPAGIPVVARLPEGERRATLREIVDCVRQVLKGGAGERGGAGRPPGRALSAPAAGGAGLLRERQARGGGGPAPGRGGRAGGGGDAGAGLDANGGAHAAGLLRRAGLGRAGGPGHGDGARGSARAPRRVDAGAVHAPAHRAHFCRAGAGSSGSVCADPAVHHPRPAGRFRGAQGGDRGVIGGVWDGRTGAQALRHQGAWG